MYACSLKLCVNPSALCIGHLYNSCAICCCGSSPANSAGPWLRYVHRRRIWYMQAADSPCTVATHHYRTGCSATLHLQVPLAPQVSSAQKSLMAPSMTSAWTCMPWESSFSSCLWGASPSMSRTARSSPTSGFPSAMRQASRCGRAAQCKAWCCFVAMLCSCAVQCRGLAHAVGQSAPASLKYRFQLDACTAMGLYEAYCAPDKRLLQQLSTAVQDPRWLNLSEGAQDLVMGLLSPVKDRISAKEVCPWLQCGGSSGVHCLP